MHKKASDLTETILDSSRDSLCMAFEDVKLTDSPIYAVYMDFVNECIWECGPQQDGHNTRNTRLPTRQYRDHKGPYTDAITMIVRTPIPNLGRGTVQEDPLSPLLFIIQYTHYSGGSNKGTGDTNAGEYKHTTKPGLC